ncbi:MDR family MFS transporter [Shimazuella kribbensis]|uniref:MDR family MFS transporter n=1 Tax=Shimazuella kribbensis TaxID=139808 RepID=UPI0003F66B4F|nr:MDR family MFS transporter [Shimazuella kribbensis]
MKLEKTKLVPVMGALLLAILVASLDNTIVSTAMGTIVGELGGLDQFVWVTSAYLIAEMAGMPIFGKLSDMYGRKRFFMLGILLFLLGSVLCGTAQNITQLSIYRAIQGIGGGALMPIAFTIIWDVFPAEQRGKMGGIFGAVFGLSSIFGPLVGAYITDFWNWRWIFYINIPIGVICLILIFLYYHESTKQVKQTIDWWGATTLVAGIVCFMFGLELGGDQYAWSSVQILSLFAGFVILFGAFLYIETKAKNPIISFAMFKHRLYVTSNFVGLFYGATFMVATIYIPLYIQGVMGGSATNSGLLLIPMMIGTTITASFGGELVKRMSYRGVMLASVGILLVGIGLLSTLTPDTSRIAVTTYMIIIGLGTGASFSVLGMAAMHHFDSHQRGAASSTNAFLRSLGMTVGITIFGVIQRNIFSDKLSATFASMDALGSADIGDPHSLLSPEGRAEIPAPILDKITAVLSTSIAQTFLWTFVPAILALLFVALMGNAKLSEGKMAQH